MAYKTMAIKDKLLNFAEDTFLAIVYDCETTGLAPKENHIIQLSARKCIMNSDGLEELESKTWYINPGYPLPSVIVNLTGITDERLENEPSEAEVIEDIVAFFEELPVIGYNNDRFDNLFMAQMYERYDALFLPETSIDVYGLAKYALEPGETENYKLSTITAYFEFDSLIETFHNAEGDTMATLLCFNRFLDMCRNMKPVVYENLIPCVVRKVSRWESKNNWKQKRLYIDTDMVTFWFDLFTRTWETKEANDRTARYDMANIVEQVLVLTGCGDEEELARFTGTVAA